MIYDGHDMRDLLLITSAERVAVPASNIEEAEVPGMDGARFKGRTLASFDIEVTAAINARDYRDVARVRRELAARLVRDEPKWLILDDEPEMRYLAVVDSSSALASIWKHATFTLTFHICDPVAYGMESGATVGTGETTVRVGGTYKTYPTARSTPSGSSYRISNVSTGEYVEVQGEFDGTGELVVYFDETRAEYKGKSIDTGVTLVSDYFALNPGDVTLAATAETELDWTERWL